MAAVLALLAVATLRCAPAAAELERLEHPAKDDGSLSLLVIGDWGRKGTFNQSMVADQVRTVHTMIIIFLLLRLIPSRFAGGVMI